jgi:hypothetical protein
MEQPQTLVQKLRFFLRGIVPYTACDEIRASATMVECVDLVHDSAIAIATKNVIKIMWPPGTYSKAVQASMQNAMAKFSNGIDAMDEDDDDGDDAFTGEVGRPPGGGELDAYR